MMWLLLCPVATSSARTSSCSGHRQIHHGHCEEEQQNLTGFLMMQELLDPVRTWLNQRMEAIHRDQWWMARSTQSAILHALCVYGPDRETMIQSLQGVLEEHTVTLVQGTIVRHCSSGAQRLLRSHTTGDSPAARSSSSSSSSIFSSFSSPNNPNSSSLNNLSSPSFSGPNNPNSSNPNNLYSPSSPSPKSLSSSSSISWIWTLSSSPEVSTEEEEEAATTETNPCHSIGNKKNDTDSPVSKPPFSCASVPRAGPAPGRSRSP
ncbi:uncharacterized protein LOC111931840 isoform X2 [Cyanistes caeruleus]|uniref:uncharacterized protein LOC111931840 isoform X2 n=1 Tax=Cyanistes caeruleus TaxID=156563 RepID=UPI000CDA61A0|nr:uncharacterized protein LOC111931840 isoform X2 [Cyanistes caeruleus]